MTSDNAAADTASGSVDRAITVLEILGRLGDASVSQVASEVGVHRSTISRLLAVLESRGMVEVAGARGRYRLGRNILRLAGGMQAALDVTVEGADAAAALAASLGETVNIAILEGTGAVNVHQAEGGSAISATSWVGRPTPLHATSSGKVLLAFGSSDAAAAVIEMGLARFTPATITDPGELRGQLEETRRVGFAMTVGELERGLNAVAAPVRGPGGAVVAALSVTGPAYRLDEEAMRAHAGAVIAAADVVGRRIGYLG